MERIWQTLRSWKRNIVDAIKKYAAGEAFIAFSFIKEITDAIRAIYNFAVEHSEIFLEYSQIAFQWISSAYGRVLFLVIGLLLIFQKRRATTDDEPQAEERSTPLEEPDDILPEEEPQPPILPICPIEFEEGTYSEIGNYTPDFKAGLGPLGLALGLEQAAKAPIAQRIYEIGIHNKLTTQTVRSVRVELESVEKLPQIDEDDDYTGALIGVPVPWGNTLNFASGLPFQDFTGDMRDKIALASHLKGGESKEDKILIHCLNRSFQHQGHKHLLNLKVTADGYQASKTQFKVWITKDGMLKMKHLSLRNRMVEGLMRRPR